MAEYVCKQCGTVLPSRGLLLSHYREVHPKTPGGNVPVPAQEEAPQGETAGTQGVRPMIPWSLLPPEMQVLRQGQQVALRGWAFVDHKAGGLVLTEIEPI